MVAAVVPGLALAAIAAGILMAAGAGGTGEFGWFAYAPLSGEAYVPSAVLFLGPRTYAGFASLVVGLLALAFWSGYRTGSARSTGRS
ncbi:hypothetical protein CVV68_07875 [Arthrobacter livingstonensis]|uniref:Uncharacterized protein n=1 Tax=Arthrobacter livingstonensis TaxID=670078 RepID=A0A2V5LZV6_9MICC|nr:hypothetical protein CVV68_07875 [Arthrobacter livingstonensis]